MSKLFFNKIKSSKYPYIIAELGSNHNGDMDLAKELILKAKKAGADCVKFQSWTKNTIFSKIKYEQNYFLKDDYRNKNINLEKIVDKYSISENQLLDMRNFAKKNNIDFASTPFSVNELNFLTNKLKPPFIKVASMDLNNYPFLEKIAQKKIPIVLSTGLSNLDEISKAIRLIEKAGNKMIIILHCVAIYPVKDKDVNLNNIDTLKKIFPYPIGFSDHSLGFAIPLAAVTKKIKVLEKHFTLNKKMEGWDHAVSADFHEMSIICKESKRIINSLGSQFIQTPENTLRKNEFRRSIIAKNNIRKGKKITNNDLDYKRPGIGIEPGETKYILGRKTKKVIEKDEIIKFEDLE